jgi:hypothetical protein
MKKIKQLMSAAILSIMASTAVSQTVDQTTDNLITGTWSNTVTNTTVVPGDGSHTQNSGPVPIYNPDTNSITFSYSQYTVSQTIAINQALSGTGIVVGGYNYSWQYYNQDWNRGTLSANISLYSSSNSLLESRNYSMGLTTAGWTTMSGTQNFNSIYDATTLGNIGISFTGRDDRFWAGYYGPMVRNVSLSLNYGVDQCVVNPQSSPTCPGYKTYYTFGDDSYAVVPIPFGYPLYGRVFTHSIFFDNGVVSFYDPLTESARLGGQQYWSESLNNNLGSQFYYSIMPLWTDLAPDGNTKLYTQSDNTYMRYTWENIQQWGHSNRPNTFSLEIRPSGYLGIQYDKINIEGYPITAGVVGNASLGEWHQTFRSEGTSVVTGGIGNWSLDYTQPTDCSNALNNPACPGYAEAYLQQQCTISALYSPSCPGYAQAYYDQQCSINPLYDVNCPGYATAYYNYQCSIDPLYHTGCPGYEQAYFDQQCSINPLYSNQCTGYEQAYFDQQCGLNGLYSTACPNYADAFYVQQCSISPLYDTGCTGYQQAFFDQQCSINSLYSTSCPNYAAAYFDQQCSISALYNSSCPGYAEAYFSQQCTADPLYNNQCPNYAEAYAKKNILNIGSTAPAVESPVVAATVESSTPQLIADPVVNQTITTTTTSASPAQPAAAVQLVAAPQTATATASTSEEKKEEPKTETAASDSAATATASTSENKDQPKTNRQALAERRLEAARAKAIEDGKQLAGRMGEAASMEAQIQIQGVVLAAMGFVPGFDSYARSTIPDGVGYRPFVIYPGQRTVDNPAGRRFLTGADARHQEMVEQQYAR